MTRTSRILIALEPHAFTAALGLGCVAAGAIAAVWWCKGVALKLRDKR